MTQVAIKSSCYRGCSANWHTAGRDWSLWHHGAKRGSREAAGARAARVSPRDLAQARPRAPAGRSRRQEPRYAAASAPGGDRPRLGLELLIRPLCVTPFIFAGRWESSTRNDWQKRESINGSLAAFHFLSCSVCVSVHSEASSWRIAASRAPRWPLTSPGRRGGSLLHK